MIAPPLDLVSFIRTGLKDDLIVSFAVLDPDDLSGIESLTLLRTPNHAFILDPHERGLSVSFDRFLDDPGRDMLKEVGIFGREKIVELRTTSRHYRLDVRKVDAKEVARMREALHRMNFDGCFRLTD